MEAIFAEAADIADNAVLRPATHARPSLDRTIDTLLEDFGYLPRVAFNLDNVFKQSGAHGK